MAAPVKPVICTANAADVGTLSASSAISSLPAINLQNSSRGRVWRSVGASAQDLFLSWGGAGKKVNFVCLYRHNLENAATWRVIAYPNVDFTGTPLYDSGTIDAYDGDTLGDLDFGFDPLGNSDAIYLSQPRFSLHFFTSLVTPLSVKVTLTDTGNSSGYLEASRLYVGELLESQYPPTKVGLKWADEGKQSRASGGSLRSDAAFSFREMDVDLGMLVEADRVKLHDMLRYSGTSRDVFMSIFPSLTGERLRDYTMIGKVKSAVDITTTNPNMYSTKLVLGEI